MSINRMDSQLNNVQLVASLQRYANLMSLVRSSRYKLHSYYSRSLLLLLLLLSGVYFMDSLSYNVVFELS